jgi:RHS repeat-associated protein
LLSTISDPTPPALSAAFAYDARKNMTFNGRLTMAYDVKGNLATVAGGGASATYAYNAFSQRVKKTVGSSSTHFSYDESGILAGEYASSGARVAEHIYLGDLPIGVAFGAGSAMRVHADYLGTPRAITNGSTLVWKWDSTDPFGANLPSVQTVVYNPRFPGQYYDAESGLHYNHHRTYDPSLGRYVQPDPIGLAGGKNPFNYANQNPLNATDPDGLECWTVDRKIGSGVNKMTRCEFPGVAIFEVPKQKGFPNELRSSETFYHDYHFKLAVVGFDPKEVVKGLIRGPTPGTSTQPATIYGTKNQADMFCEGFHDATGFHNNVTSFATPNLLTGGTVILNMTGDGGFFQGGFFNSGYVAKTLINGVVHTVGEGNSWIQANMMPFNNAMNEKTKSVWDEIIMNSISKSKGK